jgi:hypothetical protein
MLPHTLTLISSRKCIYDFRSAFSTNSCCCSTLISAADVLRFLFGSDATLKHYTDQSSATHGWFCGDGVNILPYFNALLFYEGMR